MLQRLILTLLVGTSLHAAAASFDYLPAGQGSAKEFQTLMNSGAYRQALQAWGTSHAGTSFARSANGHATYAYLLFHNGMQISALELLFKKTNPNSLSPQLLKMWNTEIANSAVAQKGWIQTRGGWKTLHNNEPVVIKIKNRQDIKNALAKADRVPKHNLNHKARIWWEVATLAPQINEVDYSLRALKLLKESGQTVIGQDQISSAMGRVLYQKGELDGAMVAFNEVPKSSSLWIETLEEKAWTSLRSDDFDKALGQSITLLSPALAPLVGPESYFLANLLSLKACDYPRIFKNSETFKKRHTPRLTGLEELSKTGTNKNILAAIDRFNAKGVSQEAAGPLVEWLPRAAYRDSKFIRFMELRRHSLNEAKKSSEIAASSLGGDHGLDQVIADSRAQADRLKVAAVNRVRALAREELKEYRQILNKMHIIEGEVIQRLAVDETLKGDRSKLAKVEDKGDVLVFPYNSDEVWFDELDNYKARVKDCPTLKGAGL